MNDNFVRRILLSFPSLPDIAPLILPRYKEVGHIGIDTASQDGILRGEVEYEVEIPDADAKFCSQCEYHLHGQPSICQAFRTPNPTDMAIDNCPDFLEIDPIAKSRRHVATQRIVRISQSIYFDRA